MGFVAQSWDQINQMLFKVGKVHLREKINYPEAIYPTILVFYNNNNHNFNICENYYGIDVDVEQMWDL